MEIAISLGMASSPKAGADRRGNMSAVSDIPAPELPPPARPKKRVVALALVALSAAVVGLAAFFVVRVSDKPTRTTAGRPASRERDPVLRGTMSIPHRAPAPSAEELCRGTGGYDDVREGAQVVVKDGGGKIIASTSLSSGKAARPDYTWRCQFDFAIQDVPKADFYQVEVSHRGALTYSRQDMEERGWFVALTLG